MIGSAARRVLVLAPFPPRLDASHGGARVIAQWIRAATDLEDVFDGVVITVVDVTTQKRYAQPGCSREDSTSKVALGICSAAFPSSRPRMTMLSPSVMLVEPWRNSSISVVVQPQSRSTERTRESRPEAERIVRIMAVVQEITCAVSFLVS